MRSPITNHRGFTMIEVMVVAVIVGILAVLAFDSMRTTTLRQQKTAAANEIFALLSQARSMARSTSVPATVTIAQVASAPGGSVVASIGAPVSWSQTVTVGAGTNYNTVGLVGAAPIGPFTISPRGTITPAAFSLNLRDTNFAANGEIVTVAVGLLGDITIMP
jgi:prepilin-type N-terminal cleavage/methylation domain-containing protein